MTTPIKRKRGETLRLTMTHAVDGVSVDLTGYTITSKARAASDSTDGAPLATATCTLDDQALRPGRFFVDFGETTAWPTGRAVCDVRIEGADVVYTPTFAIDIERAIT